MTPEQWQALNELFHAAIGRAPEERRAFLIRACAGDEALREHLERLVRAHERAEGFIGTDAATQVRPPMPDAGPCAVGRQLGPYTLVSEIGRGGMGTVYLAERTDRQYEKRVAIKLIRPGMDTTVVIRHFREERQILATLDHPNIARLLDGGTTDDGLPYVVMEFIEGIPIDQYCDTQRLSVTARLELFRRVCAAVSYAHQNLVIHRDIKPSNILVTGEGVPKLLDFGIAKILHGDGRSETVTTLGGLRPMTPEYASPEQVRGGRVSTLNEVYSLGVVLYELLSGHSPYRFESRLPDEVARVIASSEPRRPSEVVTRTEPPGTIAGTEASSPELLARVRQSSLDRLRRSLRGDLDTIVLTAIRKEPERRYPSVERFAEDIGRHLEGRPVLARKDTLTYRASKFVRRNKAPVAAAVLAFLALAGGIVATTWQAQRARAQERIAKEEQARAERRFNDLRKLAHSVLFEYHDAIKDLPGATPVRARLVHDALEYLDRLASEASSDRSLQQELASAYERVGDVQGGTLVANLGDTAGAIASYRKALRLRESLLRADPPVRGAVVDAGRSHEKLGTLLWETGDVQSASASLRKALALLEPVAARQPSDHEISLQVAQTSDRLGSLQQEQGDLPGALERFHHSRDIFESLPLAEREDQKVRRALSVCYEHIGVTLLLAGDPMAALESNRKALALRAALAAAFPFNADYRRTLGVSHYNDGEILVKLGRAREALESYRKDLAIADGLLAADPDNEQYRGDVAYALIRVGDMESTLGHGGRALAGYHRSLALRAADVKKDPVNLWKRSSLIEAHAKITKALAREGRRQAADAEAAEAVALMDKTAVEPTNAAFRSFFADTYADLGEAQVTLARHVETPTTESGEHWRAAREAYRRSLDVWQDLRQRGSVTQIDRAKPEAVAAALAQCDRMLRLGGAETLPTARR
jgi:non-specific serine/threonine protein kinase/serine/threonine-protein kinase